MKKLPAKTADVLDLIIEFATLGEYGLEYPDGPPVATDPVCSGERRRSTASPSLTPSDQAKARLHATGRPARSEESRSGDTAPFSRRTTVCSSEATDFASALRPPRIKLNFTE